MAEKSDNIDGEEWRDVPGYEGRYQASTLGRIKCLAHWINSKNGSFALRSTHIFNGKPNAGSGYIEVILRSPDGSKWRATAHRIVCFTFHGPPPTEEYEAAHNDGSRTNNRPENLRWATVQENAADRIIHGTERMGEDHYHAVFSEHDIRTIRKKYAAGETQDNLGKHYGVTRQAIWQIVHRRNWKHI